MAQRLGLQMARKVVGMKTMLTMATMAGAISLAVSHVAVAQDREAHAMRLFDASERIRQSGPCSELPFLWLTNPNMIAFLDSLLNGAYDNDGARLPEYIACFEHQRAVTNIRAVIHAEFPETEAAFKIAEGGYFTEFDIDEFIWLLEGTVKLETKGESEAGLNGSDGARTAGYDSLLEIRLATSATADVDAPTDTVRKKIIGTGPHEAAPDDFRTIRTPPPRRRPTPGRTAGVATPTDVEQVRTPGAGVQDGRLDESDRTRVPLHRPPTPNAPSEEAVIALLESLEKEIRESAILVSPGAALVPPGDDTPRTFQRKGPSPSGPTPRVRQQMREATALEERARRFREGRGSAGIGRRTMSFVPLSPENQPTRLFGPITASQVEAIRLHFQGCWVLPGGLRDALELVVRVRFGLFPDGSLRTKPTIVEPSRLRSRDFRAVAESAQRAVQECTPLEELPEASYEQWREIELAFDPRELPG